MVPLESYQMAGDFLRRIQEETGRLEQQRFDEVGTPAEIGARQAARDVATAAAIEASIPTGDRYLTETTGRSNQFEAARTAARQQRTQAEAARAVALARAATRGRPQAPVTETPSWAQRTV